MYAGEGLPTPARVPRLSFPVLSHTGSHVKSHISRRRPAIPPMTQQPHPIPSRFLWISIWSHHCKTFQLPVPFPSQVKRKWSHSHFLKWERQQMTMGSHPTQIWDPKIAASETLPSHLHGAEGPMQALGCFFLRKTGVRQQYRTPTVRTRETYPLGFLFWRVQSTLTSV